jgi:hypothetical protein
MSTRLQNDSAASDDPVPMAAIALAADAAKSSLAADIWPLASLKQQHSKTFSH